MFTIIQFHSIDLKPNNLHSKLRMTQINQSWNKQGYQTEQYTHIEASNGENHTYSRSL